MVSKKKNKKPTISKTQLKALLLLASSINAQPIDVTQHLFKEQNELISSTAKFKVAACSRQAGKSFTAATYLIKTAMDNTGAYISYLALTRQSAKRIMWQPLLNMCKKYKIKVDPSLSELTITFPNGSVIYLLGANTTGIGETLRGSPWHLVVVDEVASYRSGNLTYIIEECIQPGLITMQGTLLLIGTPTPDFGSYFYKAYHDKNMGYTPFHWTIHNNPHIPHAKQYIEDLKKKRNWTDDNPILLREYYGKFVRGSNSQIYKYNPLRNLIDTLPTHPMHYIIGLDIGGAGNDATAISILAFNPDYSSDTYVIHQEAHKKLLITDLGNKLKNLAAQYSPISIVADSGALGKAIVQELNSRFNLSIKPAEKTQKLANIEILNAALLNKQLLILDIRDNKLAEEWLNLIFKNGTKLEDPSCENNVADSVLYAFRESRAYLHQEEHPTQFNPIDGFQDNPEPDFFG